MVVVGRIESVMADGDRLQLFYELAVLGVLSPRLKKNNALIILDRPNLTKAR